MHYEGLIIRPPSEAGSILLQATVGCSHNKCTFCGTYKGQRFKIKPLEVVLEDIAYAARHMRHQRRLFICDGDALIMPQARLTAILEAIRRELPWVTRVGLYANAKSIGRKSPEELVELRSLGLGIAYLGVESGDPETLEAVRKGARAATLIRAGQRVRAAGIKLSVTVLLGVAGRARGETHARATGGLLSAMDPDYVGALSLMLLPGTPLHTAHREGRFALPDAHGLLRELREMIAHTDLTDGLFHANHASNHLPLRARLPRDKARALALLDEALAGRVALKAEFLRAL
jgi:radical SAM superfamily enzyme YgiQ (UPF0313 family)